MHEYKIINGPLADCQKILNQWKHLYNLHIISMVATNDTYGEVIILIIRTKIEDSNP